MHKNATKVGIIGCGQLGLSIAMQFITKGLPQENLYISHKGNPETAKRINSSGLSANVKSNNEIVTHCNLVFLTIKPSNIRGLNKMEMKADSILISCVAGHEISTIESIFQHKAYKIMPTSPESIENETAICGIFPPNKILEDWLKWLGFELFILKQESEFHYYTAMACLPAALLQLKINNVIINEKKLVQEANKLHLSDFETLYSRLKTEVPKGLDKEESNEFIRKMATKGGITECIINNINNGDALIQALEKGIMRSKEIALG